MRKTIIRKKKIISLAIFIVIRFLRGKCHQGKKNTQLIDVRFHEIDALHFPQGQEGEGHQPPPKYEIDCRQISLEPRPTLCPRSRGWRSPARIKNICIISSSDFVRTAPYIIAKVTRVLKMLFENMQSFFPRIVYRYF